METGIFLIKLCWCFIFLYIFRNTFKLIDFLVKNYKLKETIEESIDTDIDENDFDTSDFENVK